MGRKPKPIDSYLADVLGVIGSNIQELRSQKEMSQAELSRRSKISITTINEIETRRFRDIRVATLCAIATALNSDVTRLLQASGIKMGSDDQSRLIKASEEILRITRKLR